MSQIPLFCKPTQLESLFGYEKDYFERRMTYLLPSGEYEYPERPFKERIHFFVPDKSSKTKKAIFWSIEAVKNYIVAYSGDEELQELLNR